MEQDLRVLDFMIKIWGQQEVGSLQRSVIGQVIIETLILLCVRRPEAVYFVKKPGKSLWGTFVVNSNKVDLAYPVDEYEEYIKSLVCDGLCEEEAELAWQMVKED